MTDMNKDKKAALQDAAVYGTRFMRGNEHVPVDKALSRPAPAPGSAEVEAMLDRLEDPKASDYGPHDAEAADLIRRQAAEIERLREGLQEISDYDYDPLGPDRVHVPVGMKQFARALLNKETG